MTRAFLVALAVTTVACGGGGGRLPNGGTAACLVEVQGMSAKDALCTPTKSARVTGLQVDASGDVIVAGTFNGRLDLDRARPIDTKEVAQSFVARLGRDLGPRFVRAVDAPGAVRGIATGPRGISIVSMSTDPTDGPFLTRVDAGGAVIHRRDLAFGGLVGGVGFDPRGGLVLRVQSDGLRVVVADEDGKVLISPRVSPPWIHQFPASVTEAAFVSEVASVPDGLVTTHALGASGDGAVSDQAVSKIGPSGAVVWTRRAPIGENAQVVAAGDGGVAVLSPQGGALCTGALGATFAVTSLDRDANVRWKRCFSGRTAGLRIAAAADRIVLTGQARGTVDLGDGPESAGPSLSSFVVRLRTDGKTAKTAWLRGTNVANQALALGSDGSIYVGGVAGDGESPTQLYLARLVE